MSNKFINILKGKNQFIRLLYIAIGVISLLFLTIIPNYVFYSPNYNHIGISFPFGFAFYISLNTFELHPTFFFNIYELVSYVFLFIGILLLIALGAYLNKLNRGGIILLGITCSFMIILSPIFTLLYDFIENLVNYHVFVFFYSYYFIPVLLLVITCLGLIKILKKPETLPDGIKKQISNEIVEVRLEKRFCVKCGAFLKSGTIFCTNCGLKI